MNTISLTRFIVSFECNLLIMYELHFTSKLVPATAAKNVDFDFFFVYKVPVYVAAKNKINQNNDIRMYI